MKRNHLIASSAVTLVLLVTVPANAQILGGIHGGVGGMANGAFGGGLGPIGRLPNPQPDVTTSGRADASVNGLGHLDKATGTATQATKNSATSARDGVSQAGTKAAGMKELVQSKAQDVASGAATEVSRSATATTVSGADDGEAELSKAGASGSLQGMFSGTQGAAEPQSVTSKSAVNPTKSGTSRTKPVASEPKEPAKPGSATQGSQPSPDSGLQISPADRARGVSGSAQAPTSGTAGHGELNASASPSAQASATH